MRFFHLPYNLYKLFENCRVMAQTAMPDMVQTRHVKTHSIIPNNPLGRHTGEGRYPAIRNAPRSGQNQGVAPLTREIVNHLDSGLRRKDIVFANEQSGLNIKRKVKSNPDVLLRATLGAGCFDLEKLE